VETAALAVRDNREKHRYELTLDDDVVGVILYREQPDAYVLVHTEIKEEYEGHGFGDTLVRGALADLRERGLGYVPLCPFVQAFLRRHPEEA
jgi:predicted GNAT family acetyltransferase